MVPCMGIGSQCVARGSGDLGAKGRNQLGLDCKGPLVSSWTSFFKQWRASGGLRTGRQCVLCFGKMAGGSLESGQAWRAAWERAVTGVNPVGNPGQGRTGELEETKEVDSIGLRDWLNVGAV